MNEDDHNLTASLYEFDPVLSDPPPPRGSSRYASILERAMSRDEKTQTTIAVDHPRGRWRLPVAVGAAAALVLVAVLVLADPFGSPQPASAAEQITTAANQMARAHTFRVHGDYAEVGTILDGEVSGADTRSVFTNVDPQSGKRSTMIETVVGDRAWETIDGQTTEKPARGPEGRNAPFQRASQAVIRAALSGSDVTEVGKEKVRGVETTRYRITLTKKSAAALSALEPNELSAFELEYPQNVATIDLWIAGDLIRRIHVVGKPYGADGGLVPANDSDAMMPVTLDSTVEFYDFGAPITIRPPK